MEWNGRMIIKEECEEYPVYHLKDSFSFTEDGMECDVQFSQHPIESNGEQEFIVGEEEVDLTLATDIEDLMMMNVIDSEDEDSQSNYKENMSHVSLFNCAYCDFACSNKDTLTEHVIENHWSENISKDQQTSIDNNLSNDLLGKRTYECYLCGYKSTYSKMKDHFTKHTGNKDHKCTICEKRMGRKSDWYRHMSRHQKVKQFKCSFCPKQFMERAQTLYHERSHTGEKPFACSLCPMRFSYTSSLMRHTRGHLGDKPWQCEICLKRFSCKDNLKAHSSIHSDLKPFVCQICDKSFKRKRLWKDHCKKHETNRSNRMLYACDECPSKFENIAGLNRHKQNHAGLKRYRCLICSLDFAIRQRYMIHMDEHYREAASNLMLFKCQLCSENFSSKKDLTNHKQTHKTKNTTTLKRPNYNLAQITVPTFDCNVCSKSFNSGSGLRRHVQIHSNDKPFQCEICSKRFQLQSYLTEHNKIHSGEKTFNCIYCSKRFLRRSRLELHKRSHLNQAYIQSVQLRNVASLVTNN